MRPNPPLRKQKLTPRTKIFPLRLNGSVTIGSRTTQIDDLMNTQLPDAT